MFRWVGKVTSPSSYSKVGCGRVRGELAYCPRWCACKVRAALMGALANNARRILATYGNINSLPV